MIEVTVQNTDKPMTEAEAKLFKKNFKFFCSTPKGSLPQNREYGLDYSIFDEPFPVLRMKATVDIISGIRKEYGVQIKTIDITANENGGIKIKVSI